MPLAPYPLLVYQSHQRVSDKFHNQLCEMDCLMFLNRNHQSDYLMNKRHASIKAIKYGQSGKITVNGKHYNNVMASLGLEDAEIAHVMNYITNSWGNSNNKLITEEEVSKIEP